MIAAPADREVGWNGNPAETERFAHDYPLDFLLLDRVQRDRWRIRQSTAQSIRLWLVPAFAADFAIARRIACDGNARKMGAHSPAA